MMKEKKQNHIMRYFIVFLISFLLLGVVWLFLGRYLSSYILKGSSNGNTCYTKCENKVTITDTGISDAVSKVYDAVVLIQNYQNDNLYATGTGFVYKVDDKYGYILTNYHVIENQTKIDIVLTTDEIVTAKYLGGDSYLDIAVLSIPKDKVIKVAELSSSENSKLGDTVFTIGTPVDYEYRGTVTRGILSGKNRLVTIESTNGDYIAKVLQTDAAMNPGNSGGPLVNINGQVIGINSLKFVEEKIEGMGFAIAIEDISEYLDTLESGKQIKRPLLGITMDDVANSFYLRMQGIIIDSNIKNGVVVTSTIENTNAYNVLKIGDVITKINDTKVNSLAYLRYELYKYNVGDTIKITFIRDGKKQEAKIKLVSQD